MLENEQVSERKFNKEDILVNRDLDFINRIKLPTLYNDFITTWNKLDRNKKASIIMNYVDKTDYNYRNINMTFSRDLPSNTNEEINLANQLNLALQLYLVYPVYR